MELVASGPRVGTICTCGIEISYPEVYNTGVRPNERAAERLRYKAFRAAGLVKNIGGFAMGLAFLGILFFPLALVGAVLGMYVLTMVRGPLGRYSGRNAAIVAIAVGVGVFATESSILWSYISHRRSDRLIALQTSAADDLRTLLRTQRLYRAAQDRFGSLKESRFQPRVGAYTIYLGLDDYVAGVRDEQTVTDALPNGLHPKVTPTGFLAYAVANLDGDPEVDVWSVDDSGEVKHLTNDVPWIELPANVAGNPTDDGPKTPIVAPEVLTASKDASAKTAKERADAAKEAVKAADKAKASADKAKADADKASADAAKAVASAEKARAAAEKAATEAAAAEPAKADAAKAAAQKAADTAKAEATKAETAKADAAKKAELAAAEAIKAEAAKADATKATELARLEAEQAKKNEELAKAEAEAAKKAAAEKAAADKAAADAAKKADAEKAKAAAEAAKKADAVKAAADKAAVDASKKADAAKDATDKAGTDAAKKAEAEKAAADKAAADAAKKADAAKSAADKAAADAAKKADAAKNAVDKAAAPKT
jgi:hypothetical protein